MIRKLSFKFSCGLALLSAILFHYPLNAQELIKDTATVPNFYDMSLEQLMGIELTVASRQSMTTRESPGIVSLITEDEIRSSGARDLMDILRMIPGFDFCVDVEGVVGIAVRGNWAHEGKALLLIDGLEMNENLYSTLQFGNHYPIDNIKRIEIIRGPGSAMYGGNAEYAVINIISKSPSDINGAQAKLAYGQMSSSTGHYSGSVSAGNQFKDFGFTINAFTGKAIRSDRTYTDIENGSYEMSENSDLISNYLNVGLKFKKLNFRGIIDRYTVNTKDDYNIITIKTYPVRFDTYMGELRQEITLSSKLLITPFLNFKTQLPWMYNGDIVNNEIVEFHMQSSRYTAGFNTAWNPSEKFNIIGGADYFYDIAKQKTDEVFMSNGRKQLNYNSTSIFAQANWKTKIVDITAGTRYNYNDRYSASFVPRLSVTKVLEKLHFKLLYSEAYRAPNTQNLDLNVNILPEHTIVVEFEAGVKILPTIYITGNLYDITTKNPILFYYNTTNDQDAYYNATRTGTRGFEVDLQWKFPDGYVNINYGFYSAAGKNDLMENNIPQREESLLGIPNHKIALTSHFQLGLHYSINPSASFHGAKYGVTGFNASDDVVINRFEPYAIFNLTFRAEQLIVKNLGAGISMFNILNQEEGYLQPYTGGHAELPGSSREFVVNLTYRFLNK